MRGLGLGFVLGAVGSHRRARRAEGIRGLQEAQGVCGGGSSCLSGLSLPVSRWPPASRPKDACKGVRKQNLFQKPPLHQWACSCP